MLGSLPAHMPDDPDEPDSWKARGLCRETDPDTFFPEQGEGDKVAAARRICRRCDVRAACLEYALANRERYGVWGGASERERRRIERTRRGLAATREEAVA